MISFLRGTVQAKEITGGPSDRLVIEVAGVGFELLVSRSTLAALPEAGAEVTVHTALSIRETEWIMFGFASRAEREMFHLLQSVSGVGPKLALALVGTIGPERIASAVAAEDQKLLSQAPGVGAKVAQRIILELQGKIDEWQAQKGAAVGSAPRSLAVQEARAILEGLGYTATEINMAFTASEDEAASEDVEALVRRSLKVLGAAGRN